MKKLLVLVAMAAALTACSKKEEAAPAAPAAAPAATAAPAAAPAASTVSTAAASLPKECNDYFDKVSACVTKQSGAAADAMKSSMEQARSSWAAMGADQAALGAACKQANDAFAGQAAMMKC